MPGTAIALLAPPNTDLVLLESPNALAAELALLDEALQDTLAASVAPATTRVYLHDWSMFESWTAAHGLPSLPASPKTVARYLTDLSKDHAPATIGQHMSAISSAHQAAGFEEPPTRSLLVRKTVSGLRRQLGVAPAAKTALMADDLHAIVPHLRPGIIGIRDKALLCVGLVSGMRRSELVALDVDDLQWSDDGVAIVIRRSKVDQEGQGAKVAVGATGSALCPVAALRAWLDAAGIEEGAVWRQVDRHGNVGGRLSGSAVAVIVKFHVEAIGKDPASFGAHSMRAGMATAGAKAGVSMTDLMRQGRWSSEAMCRRYVREGDLFHLNMSLAIGL
jgi:integrase